MLTHSYTIQADLNPHFFLEPHVSEPQSKEFQDYQECLRTKIYAAASSHIALSTDFSGRQHFLEAKQSQNNSQTLLIN